MKLLSLHLKGFRTYADLRLDFARRLCFLTGPNANGKTNVLEAIGMLSLGKSFRGALDEDLVRTGAGGYYVEARFEKLGQKNELSMGVDLGGGKLRRRIRLNGNHLAGRSALIGQLVAVIFSPQDILIAEGGPAYRRRFLDLVLSYQNPAYLQDLLLYNRALRQRNAILKKIKSRSARLGDLDPWNAGLGEYAVRITQERARFVSEFQRIFEASLARISGDRDLLRLRLLYSADGEDQDFLAALRKNIPRDAAVGSTSVGPHRHSLAFERDGQDVLRFGSQGQRRSLVLALRIAQFSFLRASLGVKPLLLIDDVIRELDARRRDAFVGLLRECGQALFTTPDLDGISLVAGDLRDEVEIFSVTEPGRIQPAV